MTSFHLIEHLPFDQLLTLLEELLRVLQPGGFTILESPNPENLIVCSTFHFDPSHHRPIHPELLKMLMQQVGFKELDIRRLREHRHDHRMALLAEDHPTAEALNPVIDFLNNRFAAASDFAVIGRKPF